PPGWSVFLLALRRRHVVRAAAVYAATAFVVLRGVQLLAQRLALPASIFSAATVLTIAGLPIALVLASAFELTPDGVRRAESIGETSAARGSPPARTVSLIVVLLAIGGALVLMVRPAVRGATGGRPAGQDAAHPSLAVLPFTNLGAPDDAYFAEGMAD